MSEKEENPSDPEPVDAEFETIEDESDETDRSRSGPGRVMFGVWVVGTAILASAVTWALTVYVTPVLDQGPDLSGIEDRLQAMENAVLETETVQSRITSIQAETRQATSAYEQAVSQLRNRIATLESTLTNLQSEMVDASGDDPVEPFDPTPFETRLSAIEGQLLQFASAIDALGQTIDSNTAGDQIDPVVDTGVLESMMDTITTLQTRLSEVEAGLSDQASLERVDALQARVDDVERQLESGLASLQTETGVRQNEAGELRVISSRALALTALRDAASGSAPFEAERAALYRVWRTNSSLRDLETLARSGVASRTSLLRNYPAQAVRDAAGETRTLFGFIQVRPSDGRDDADGPLTIASQIETRLANGDLDGAVEAARRLTGEPSAAASNWLESAENRLRVEQIMNQLRSSLALEAEAQGVEG